MPAIVRKPQSIFASALIPVGNLAVYGSLKDTAPAYSTDPAVLQSAEWPNGLNGAVIGNRSLAQEDLNSLFYVLTYQLAYLLQGGVPEWDATTTYWSKQIVRVPGTSFLAASRTDNNTNNNPATDSNNWTLTPISGAIQALSSGAQVVAMDGTPHKLLFPGLGWNPSGAWNIATSIFTAPIAGLYEFNVTLQVDNTAALTDLDAFIRIIDVDTDITTGYLLAQGWGQDNPPGARWYPSVANCAVLSAGQRVAVYLGRSGAGAGNVSVSNSFLSISRKP